MNKINSYIGFAIKANDAQFGLDNLTKSTKVVLVKSNVSNNTLLKLNNLSLKYNFKIFIINNNSSICFPAGVKLLGIKNINLAQQIINVLSLEENN